MYSYDISGNYNNNNNQSGGGFITNFIKNNSNKSKSKPSTQNSLINQNDHYIHVCHNKLNQESDFAVKQSSDGTTNLNSKNDRSIQFSIGGVPKHSITPMGMGIGTLEPKEQLHVIGNTYLKGDVEIKGRLIHEPTQRNMKKLLQQIDELTISVDKKLQQRLGRMDDSLKPINIMDQKIKNFEFRINKLENQIGNFQKSLKLINTKMNHQITEFTNMNSELAEENNTSKVLQRLHKLEKTMESISSIVHSRDILNH